MAGSVLETHDRLSPTRADAVRTLITTVTVADGVRPVSEAVLLSLTSEPREGARHHLLIAGEHLAGYAFVQPDRQGPVGEIVADSDEGLRALLVALGREYAALRVWARGDGSRAGAVLDSLGARPRRVLLQLRRPLDEPLPEPEWPEGTTVRTFEVGRDEAAWLEVNAAAFADHPEQGSWTMADLTNREAQPWFDPAGFFLADCGEELVGFHWTKVHQPAGRDTTPIGEVYVVGVAPSMQGRRLGPALTLHGLRHLQQRGLPAVKLYVEADNAPAIAVYEKLGFSRWDADVCYEIGVSTLPG